jgi:hypothetical protein
MERVETGSDIDEFKVGVKSKGNALSPLASGDDTIAEESSHEAVHPQGSSKIFEIFSYKRFKQIIKCAAGRF